MKMWVGHGCVWASTLVLAACVHRGGSEALGRGDCGSHRPSPKTANTERVVSFVRAKSGDVQFCYEWALRQSRTVQGCVVVAFSIDGSGALYESRPVWNTTGSDVLGRCIASAVRSVGNIADADAGEYLVPFVLQPER